jgi:hypothetical protein
VCGGTKGKVPSKPDCEVAILDSAPMSAVTTKAGRGFYVRDASRVYAQKKGVVGVGVHFCMSDFVTETNTLDSYVIDVFPSVGVKGRVGVHSMRKIINDSACDNVLSYSFYTLLDLDVGDEIVFHWVFRCTEKIKHFTWGNSMGDNKFSDGLHIKLYNF